MRVLKMFDCVTQDLCEKHYRKKKKKNTGDSKIDCMVD